MDRHPDELSGVVHYHGGESSETPTGVVTVAASTTVVCRAQFFDCGVRDPKVVQEQLATGFAPHTEFVGVRERDTTNPGGRTDSQVTYSVVMGFPDSEELADVEVEFEDVARNKLKAYMDPNTWVRFPQDSNETTSRFLKECEEDFNKLGFGAKKYGGFGSFDSLRRVPAVAHVLGIASCLPG
jgi:hypothetical protein